MIAWVHDRTARAFSWTTDFICSKDGKPSNPKLMAWAVWGAFVTGHGLPASVCAMLLAASFGIKTFQMWLQKSSFAITEADTVAIKYERILTETVQKRRDPVDGIEAAP